jgi:[acyl-carrier-protein] S-malonyltransferase
MSQIAFLFPGQGSQSLGMLSALAEDFDVVGATCAQASAVLGYDLWDVMQNGPAKRLNQTEVTQPAMLAAGVATWRAWRELGGGEATRLAGHSLGEYSALVVAGVMSFEDAVASVAERGRLMQSATPAGTGAMAAILGLDDNTLAEICAAQSENEVVSCANYNSPGQVVIAGHTAAVARVCEAAKSAGARRALPLPVSVPSHCALMRSAADSLAGVLASVNMQPARLPVTQNADVATHDSADDIRDALTRQLWQPVRWTETIRSLVDSGVDRFAECGPGKVLTGLTRRISKQSGITALTDKAAMQTLLEG